MKVRRAKQVLAATLVLAAWLLPAGVDGQISWHAPLLVSPGTPAGFSLFIAEMEPVDGVAGMVAWRQEPAPGSIGFRLGIGEGGRDKAAGFGAFDYSGPIHAATEEFPLDVAWVTGAGVGVGEYVLLGIPVGASFAYEIMGPDIWLTPYVTPMFTLDWALGGSRPRDEFDLGLAVDFGADLAFSSSWAIRVGATVGDRQGVAIGLHFPGVEIGG